MAAGTVSLHYFILGLLAQQSMSGYDIRRLVKSLGWLMGSPSSGSLYPILHALPEEGLATVETIPGVDRPSKKLYTITKAGRRELQAWIEQPAGSTVPLKAFVMRLILADSYSPAGLRAHLQQRRDRVAEYQADLHQTVNESREIAGLGRLLVMDYGWAMAAAELAWLDHTLSELPEQPLPQESE